VLLAIHGKLSDPKTTRNVTSFAKKYSPEDIRLLATVDKALNFPCGYALQQTLKRAVNVFHETQYLNLSNISHGHLYNLRKSAVYRQETMHFQKTMPVVSNIGVREKPNPKGPGYLRLDCVHGGEKDGKKGVYYLNIVDEVTQFEVVYCLEGISELYLRPVWEHLQEIFPFWIIQFHTDNGSEFINRIVESILEKLRIRQSKSRANKTTDNAMVECKNGKVIRKQFGYWYIPTYNADLINTYLHAEFNIYLNYHRQCAFPRVICSNDGKTRKIYEREDYKTPYEKLREVDPKGKTLRDGITFAKLDEIAYSKSDIEYCLEMRKEYLRVMPLARKEKD
jgi:transposase InsO family protein